MPTPPNHRDKSCLFCEVERLQIVAQNEEAYTIRDRYPVTKLHSLIVPKRHVLSYFDLDESEIVACTEILRATRDEIVATDNSVSGFNIAINNGADAGQSVPHCHIHLIPRRKGDVDEPRGGLRRMVPGKGDYRRP